MKKNLILMGPIGCGKSTMIKNALGEAACFGGGYVTYRDMDGDRLSGFDLAPTSTLSSREGMRRIQRFLDFSKIPPQNPEVFATLGRDLLREALKCPYAVLDEFGGMELLIPEFKAALLELLKSSVPCIGVFKTPHASKELQSRVDPGTGYKEAYVSLKQLLSEDPDTELLETTGRYDEISRETVDRWIKTYVRK